VAAHGSHGRLSDGAEAWLLYFAHPEISTSALMPPTSLDASELADLFAAAELHGVLPATLRGVERQLRVSPQSTQRLIDDARLRVARHTAMGLLLFHHAARATAALKQAGIEALVLKGPTFARRVYGEPWLRTFTDIDLMIAPRHRAQASTIMPGLGFEPLPVAQRGERDYCEDKWILASNDEVMIEVHANLVHAPKLRRKMSVGFEDIRAAGDGDAEDAAALLLVAGAHGAVGHQFERLQHLVDVARIAAGAAGPIDVDRLRSVAARCGVTPAIVAALELANRAFPDPEARALARRFRRSQLSRLPSLLLSPQLTVRTQGPQRAYGSWRRKVFRQVLRLASLRRFIAAPPITA